MRLSFVSNPNSSNRLQNGLLFMVKMAIILLGIGCFVVIGLLF